VSRVVFHVLHWEAAKPADEAGGDPGIVFGEPLSRDNKASDPSRWQQEPGPCLCLECDGVVHIDRFHMDSVHATIRMLAKEGTELRTEVEDFNCFSPNMALEYQMMRFRDYTRKIGKLQSQRRRFSVHRLRCTAHFVFAAAVRPAMKVSCTVEVHISGPSLCLECDIYIYAFATTQGK